MLYNNLPVAIIPPAIPPSIPHSISDNVNWIESDFVKSHVWRGGRQSAFSGTRISVGRLRRIDWRLCRSGPHRWRAKQIEGRINSHMRVFAETRAGRKENLRRLGPGCDNRHLVI